MKGRELSPFVDLLGMNNPRKLFIRAVNDVATSVVSDLAEKVYPLYIENRSVLEGDPGRLTPAKLSARVALHDAICAWGIRHHLVERHHIAGWMFDCASYTLERWAANGCASKLLCPKTTDSPLDLRVELQNLTEAALAHVCGRLAAPVDDLVSGGSEDAYTKAVARICEEEIRQGFDAFRSELKEAVVERDAALSESENCTFPRRTEVRLDFEPVLHARWAVRYQVLEQSFEDMEGNTRDASVMRKVVRAFLSTIRLTPRRPPGRPPARKPPISPRG